MRISQPQFGTQFSFSCARLRLAMLSAAFSYNCVSMCVFCGFVSLTIVCVRACVRASMSAIVHSVAMLFITPSIVQYNIPINRAQK